MKRQRRTFTNQFKRDLVNAILNNKATRKQLSEQHSISLPLIERWVNDYLAADYPERSQPVFKERRQDYSTTQELKAKIAELYMQIEKMNRTGLTWKAPRHPEMDV